MSFNVGEVVQLKSGGPLMTVSETNDAGVVECTWFNSENNIQKQAFNQEMLKIYRKQTPRVLPSGIRL
ncbi:YodC family protein [Acinetobacter pecorum]|uniref:DUF2158 domain-containing protein n=1 Tax=Acinetobacter pecorum TaxID=2762215 RepID=A0ABR8VVF7_9GAMM|nr:DUF2158 domain-containing protein [Acinetobacter pecorum]MBD8008758.1 DUF2158 domain-containing protein [Acinetobacter pecorum]